MLHFVRKHGVVRHKLHTSVEHGIGFLQLKHFLSVRGLPVHVLSSAFVENEYELYHDCALQPELSALLHASV